MLAEKIRCMFLQVSFHRYPGISSKGISAMTSVKTVLSKPCPLSFSFFAILVKLRYIRGHLSTNHLSQLAVIAFSCPFCQSNVNHIESHPIFRINFFLYSTPSFPTAKGQPQWLPLCLIQFRCLFLAQSPPLIFPLIDHLCIIDVDPCTSPYPVSTDVALKHTPWFSYCW